MATIGSVTIGIKAETKQFDKQINDVEHKIKVLTETIEKKKELGLTATEIKQYEIELEKTKNKLIDIKKKKEDINKTPVDSEGFNGFGGIIKKITKIGLGLVGLRTGMALLRSSISTVAGQNDEIATKINTIKSAIANALTPVVQAVVNLFAKLIAYAGYILKAWFGIDIFAKNTAKNTKKMKSNLGGANKEATKLKRTLAGFDEMNILQADGGVSSGGGGGGISPDDMIDMSMFDNIEIPGWVQWIADNKELIVDSLKQIAIMMGIAFAVGGIINFITKMTDLKTGLGALSKSLEGMSSLQIFGIIAGIATTIFGIIQVVEALTDDTIHLENVLGGVSTMLIGIGTIVATFSPWGWVLIGVGLLGELASAFIDTRSEEEKLEEANKKVRDSQREVNDAYRDFTNANKTHLNAYKSLEKAKQNVSKTAKELGIDENKLNEIGADLFEGIRNGTIDINTLKKGNEDLTETYKLSKDQLLQVYESYIDLKDSEAQLTTATDKLATTQQTLTEKQKQNTRDTLEQQVEIFKISGKYDELGKKMGEAYRTGSISLEELAFVISQTLDQMDEETRQTFAKNLPADLKLAIAGMNDTKIAFQNLTAKEYVLKFGMNTSDVQQKIENLKKKIQQLKMGKFTINLGVQSANGSVLYNFANGGLLGLPRLAPGGIVNNPGPGINYRGANIGERGAEAVVPLTNSQMMSQLGEAIARYVNIRAEIPVSIGNRQVAREIRYINADEDFAYNG